MLSSLSSLAVIPVLLAALPGQLSIPVAKGVELKFRAPSRWKYLGPDGEGGAARAVFAAPRSYASTKSKKHGGDHVPTIRVLWIGKAEVAAEANADKRPWPMLYGYRGLDDFLKRAYGPSAAISSVDECKIGSAAGQANVLTIKRDTGDLSALVCSAKLDEGELLVEFQCIAEQFGKLRKAFDRSLAGAGLVQGAAAAAPVAIGAVPGMADPAAWSKRSAAKRRAARADWGKAYLAARRKLKVPGYKAKLQGSLLVLSRTDSKYTKRISAAAKLAHAWIDKHFAAISDDEVMPATLRIFDSREELTTYLGAGAAQVEYHPQRREIYAYKDASSGNLGDGYGNVIRGVWMRYLHDKHPLILNNMPRWMTNGMWAVLDSTRVVKNKKLLFFPSEVEIGRFDHHAKQGQVQKTWWFIQDKMGELPKDGEAEAAYGYTPESARILRWWLEGDADGLFKQKNVFCAYLAFVGKAAEEFKPRPDLGVDWRFMAEEQQKELRKAMYARREEFLNKVNYGVIPLKEHEWAVAGTAWAKFYAEYQKRKFKKK